MNRRTTDRMIAKSSRKGCFAALAFSAGLAACESSHAVPAHPTWADVEPVLRAECLHCHGGSAPVTASTASAVYRFDFYDLPPEICGDASTAIALPNLAAGWSTLMANAITSADPSIRPKMPPAPAPSLATWEWQTILRWAADPQKGAVPVANRPPTIRRTDVMNIVDSRLRLSVVLEDPDGESAVGVLTVGDFKLKLDRPGAFLAEVDTSAWAAGDVAVQAVVCDGWTSATYRLDSVTVKHP